MRVLRFDDALLTPRGAVAKCLAVTPVAVAVATAAVALLQAVNGLATETTIETLVLGWLVATVAALVVWPTPSVLPSLDVGRSADEAGTDGAATSEDDDEALQRLRDRYAAGEIDRQEFERRLEKLLATEPSTAEEEIPPRSADRAGAERERTAEPE